MEKFNKLIKDVLQAAISVGVVMLLLVGTNMDANTTAMLAFFAAGIPFGWRWASHILTAVSIQGVLIKLAFSVCLGWLALGLALAGDVFGCIRALCRKRQTT